MPLNIELLNTHLKQWSQKQIGNSEQAQIDQNERAQRVVFYQGFTADRIKVMTREDLYEYLSRLWAMRIWGNKHYVVNTLLEKHSLEDVRNELAALIWGNDQISLRWDVFRKKISGLGPAMMSEILCHVHPEKYLLWNRRAYVALRYLGVEGLPKYNYQMTGERYSMLCNVGNDIANAMRSQGIPNVNHLKVDYFIWDELQVEDNLTKISTKKEQKDVEFVEPPKTDTAAEFLHDEVKEKLADIGTWLGFKTEIEVKVADGSVVDTVWQATIGNMGRVIYVFEVQTKGSIDSLIINLLKSLNNPAVQGVVAVSDKQQIEKIKKHAMGVKQLHEKLKYWDYLQVLEVHESLEGVNEAINGLGLVPEGF